jgi:hypothetical protein
VAVEGARGRVQRGIGRQQGAHRLREAIIAAAEGAHAGVAIGSGRVICDLVKDAFDPLPAFGIHHGVEHTI